MSSQEFAHLLEVLTALSLEQLNLLRRRLDAAAASVADEPGAAAEADESLQRRLLGLGIISDIKPARRPNRSFTPIVIVGEPLSQTILRERR